MTNSAEEGIGARDCPRAAELETRSRSFATTAITAFEIRSGARTARQKWLGDLNNPRIDDAANDRDHSLVVRECVFDLARAHRGSVDRIGAHHENECVGSLDRRVNRIQPVFGGLNALEVHPNFLVASSSALDRRPTNSRSLREYERKSFARPASALSVDVFVSGSATSFLALCFQARHHCRRRRSQRFFVSFGNHR